MKTHLIDTRPIESDVPRDLIVRLKHSSKIPATSLERVTVDMLRAEGSVPFHILIERVTRELYSQELKAGAWVLEIGIFGSALFVPDVVRQINAGNGTLWHIEKQL